MPLPAHLRVRVMVRETATAKIHGFNLYYVNGGTHPLSEEIQVIANNFKTAFNAAMPGILTTAHEFLGVEVVYTGGGVQLDAMSAVAATAGTVSGDVMPEETAALIQRRTGLQGRAKRGRVFLPCVPDSFVTGSALTGAALTAYTAVAEMMKNTVVTEVADPDWEPRQPSPSTNALLPITQTRVYSEVVSRRDRRFIKRGVVTVG